MMWNDSTIILAIIGMVGLFSTAMAYQRANWIANIYYSQNKRRQAQGQGQDETT